MIGAAVIAVISPLLRKFVYMKDTDEPLFTTRFAVMLNIMLVVYFVASFLFSFDIYGVLYAAYYGAYPILAFFASLAAAGFSVSQKHKKPSR